MARGGTSAFESKTGGRVGKKVPTGGAGDPAVPGNLPFGPERSNTESVVPGNRLRVQGAATKSAVTSVEGARNLYR